MLFRFCSVTLHEKFDSHCTWYCFRIPSTSTDPVSDIELSLKHNLVLVIQYSVLAISEYLTGQVCTVCSFHGLHNSNMEAILQRKFIFKKSNNIRLWRTVLLVYYWNILYCKWLEFSIFPINRRFWQAVA